MSTSQAQHFHGGVLHDHPGGDIPYDHPDPGRMVPMGGDVAAVVFGVAAAVAGILVVLVGPPTTAPAARRWCNPPPWGGARPTTSSGRAGVIGLVAGIALATGGVIVRSIRP